MDSIINDFMIQKAWEDKTELCSLMTKHGSDKASWHNYTTLYSRLFAKFNNQIINVFELGLGANNLAVPSNMGPTGVPGASLRAWKEYFPNANIYGADIDHNILFGEDRISTFFVDQTNPQSVQFLWNIPKLRDIKFDIIVDDGLHAFYANDTLLSNSFSKLNEGGIYIVEDIQKNFFPDFEKNMSKYLQWFSYARLVPIPYSGTNDFENNGDNTVLVLYK
jgi:hypothetical protein